MASESPSTARSRAAGVQMSKFLKLIEAGQPVNAAAVKLFSTLSAGDAPQPAESEVLAARRSELDLGVLFAWHRTNDPLASASDVVRRLREDGATAWWMLERDCADLPATCVRDWLRAFDGSFPSDRWMRIAERVVCRVGQRILAPEVMALAYHAAMPQPVASKFWQIVVDREDDELLSALRAWLATVGDATRVRHMFLLHRANVLHLLDDALALLPNVHPGAPAARVMANETAHLVHWLALHWHESQRAAADEWIIRCHLGAVREGARWIDVFWRVPPRLRAALAIESMSLDSESWAPFAGTALAAAIASGASHRWPAAMRWLDIFRLPVRDGFEIEREAEWMEQHLRVAARLRGFGGRTEPDWFKLSLDEQLAHGPLFAASADDGAAANIIFDPRCAGVAALTSLKLPTDESVDDAWAKFYSGGPQAVPYLTARFEGQLTGTRSRRLLDLAIREPHGLLHFDERAIDELTTHAGYVDVSVAPCGAALIALESNELRLWWRAIGPAFDTRVDEWIDSRLAANSEPFAMLQAVSLDRPFSDARREKLRALARAWSLGWLITLRAQLPWIASDDELVARARELLAAGDEQAVFGLRTLPECFEPLVRERVDRVEDERLAGELREWLMARGHSEEDLAWSRLRARPDARIAVRFGQWLTSRQRYDTRGADVIGALLNANAFELAWICAQKSLAAFEERTNRAAAAVDEGARPRKAPDVVTFMGAMHAAFVRAICARARRACTTNAGAIVDRSLSALLHLEPPPRAVGDLRELVGTTGFPSELQPRAQQVIEIFREGDEREAHLYDIHQALTELANDGVSS